MRLHKQAHTTYASQYHIVCVTRNRHPWITPRIDEYLKLKLRGVSKRYPDWETLEIGIDKDHVHVQIIITRKNPVSSVVNTLNSNRARETKENSQPWLKHWYWNNGGIWSPGFFSATVGINEQVIRNYVQHQRKDHAGQAQLALL